MQEVRACFFHGLYSLDRIHLLHPCVDGNHYWIHVYDSGHGNGPLTTRLWN